SNRSGSTRLTWCKRRPVSRSFQQERRLAARCRSRDRPRYSRASLVVQVPSSVRPKQLHRRKLRPVQVCCQPPVHQPVTEASLRKAEILIGVFVPSSQQKLSFRQRERHN